MKMKIPLEAIRLIQDNLDKRYAVGRQIVKESVTLFIDPEAIAPNTPMLILDIVGDPVPNVVVLHGGFDVALDKDTGELKLTERTPIRQKCQVPENLHKDFDLGKLH